MGKKSFSAINLLQKNEEMAVNEMTRLYDILLSIPRMNDQIKLNLQMSRKLVFVLSKLLEGGMRMAKDNPDGVLSFFPEQIAEELRAILRNCSESRY